MTIRKPRYERPIIVRHALGGADKFGAANAARPMPRFEGVSVEELVARYGSPLFVFSERLLRRRARELRAELGRRFADFVVAWSYKTNYLGAVCEVMHQEGAFAEVVSGMELAKALHGGVPGERILFNGPAKSAADLALAFEKGVEVHLDHLDELQLAEQVAQRLGVRPKVGLRVHLADVPVQAWDRFGLHLENGSAEQAVRRLLKKDVLELAALHTHIGTFVLDPAAYRHAARSLARFARKLERDHGVSIETLDLGGGFASHNTLRGQYLPGDELTPSLGQYVEALSDGLDEGLEGGRVPRVALETGRALVDDAAILVATVVANKRLGDGRRGVVLDAGVNVLPTAFWYRHDVFPVAEPRGVAEPTVFFGPLCMNIDVVREALMFAPLEVGERVVLGHVGAYNVTQWMQFITTRPAVVMVSERGEHGVVRRAETLSALTDYEEMPAWLRR